MQKLRCWKASKIKIWVHGDKSCSIGWPVVLDCFEYLRSRKPGSPDIWECHIAYWFFFECLRKKHQRKTLIPSDSGFLSRYSVSKPFPVYFSILSSKVEYPPTYFIFSLFHEPIIVIKKQVWKKIEKSRNHRTLRVDLIPALKISCKVLVSNIKYFRTLLYRDVLKPIVLLKSLRYSLKVVIWWEHAFTINEINEIMS